jgi:Ni,Fe-hydrogenase maturation factor
MKVLCFGNRFVRGDNIALKLADSLKLEGVEFLKCEDLSDLERVNDDVTIIDTVLGLKDIEVITNIDSLQLSKMYSLHDFDLGFHLKLYKELGKIKSVKIIGIPFRMKLDDVKEEITKLLQ